MADEGNAVVVRLREMKNGREAEADDGLLEERREEEDEEGREEREKWEKKKKCIKKWIVALKIVLGIVILITIALVGFFAYKKFCPLARNSTPSSNETDLLSPSTTTTALPPITQPLLRCSPSEIPSIGNSSSHPFGSLENSEWKERVFLPCSNAIGYNKALMGQLNNEMEGGLWTRDGNGLLVMKNETEGKDKFMKSFMQFVISFAGIQDGSVTVDELVRHFGKDFDKIKCLKIQRNELPLSLPCSDAAFSDALTEKERAPFPNVPEAFMSYIQSKVVLFTVFLGEMKYSLTNVVSKGPSTDFFDAFFPLTKDNNRPQMLQFLNNRTGKEIAEMAMAVDRILDKIVRCMEKINPIPGKTWKIYYSEQCLNFGDSINWNEIINRG